MSVLHAIKENGYTVVEQALSQEEVARARKLLWDHLEKAYPGMREKDPRTWSELSDSGTGFVHESHQCEGAWYVRSRPGVTKAFKDVWKTEDLVTSMDTVIAWTPWRRKVKPKRTEGLHLDQLHGGLDTIQGMVVLQDVTRETGGLEVLRGSHKQFSQISKRVPKSWKDTYWYGNWGPLPPNMYPAGSGELILASAGDLILWDSRTVHGGIRGEGGSCPNELARLAVTVCMKPRSCLTKEVAKIRKRGFQEGWHFNHHPTSPEVTGKPEGAYVPLTLDDQQLALL